MKEWLAKWWKKLVAGAVALGAILASVFLVRRFFTSRDTEADAAKKDVGALKAIEQQAAGQHALLEATADQAVVNLTASEAKAVESITAAEVAVGASARAREMAEALDRAREQAKKDAMGTADTLDDALGDFRRAGGGK